MAPRTCLDHGSSYVPRPWLLVGPEAMVPHAPRADMSRPLLLCSWIFSVACLSARIAWPHVQHIAITVCMPIMCLCASFSCLPGDTRVPVRSRVRVHPVRLSHRTYVRPSVSACVRACVRAFMRTCMPNMLYPVDRRPSSQRSVGIDLFSESSTLYECAHVAACVRARARVCVRACIRGCGCAGALS